MKNMYQGSLKQLILLVLVISAVFLGVVIYKKSNFSVQNQNLDSNAVPIIDPTAFSPDERKLLIPPGPEATQEEIDEHTKLAAKLAVLGNQVEINNCKSEPIVLQTKLGSMVSFKNSGSYDISIAFDADNILNVGVGKSLSTSKAFIHGPGLYGYLCEGDNFKGLIGFILLTS